MAKVGQKVFPTTTLLERLSWNEPDTEYFGIVVRLCCVDSSCLVRYVDFYSKKQGTIQTLLKRNWAVEIGSDIFCKQFDFRPHRLTRIFK